MKKEQLQRRFNPCFNGTYSLTFYLKTPNVLGKTRFNPCFNGTYSLTFNNVCIM